jgi:hypothetical protein
VLLLTNDRCFVKKNYTQKLKVFLLSNASPVMGSRMVPGSCRPVLGGTTGNQPEQVLSFI